MTPGSAPAVRFDPALVRRDYRDAGQGLLDVAELVPHRDWDRPALGQWSVRDLVGHAGRAFATVSSYLDSGRGAAIALDHPFDYAAAFSLVSADPDAVIARGRQAGADLGADPAVSLRGLYESALADLARAPDDAPAATIAGVMRVIDYLPSRVFELVVHTDDLSRAVGVPHQAPQGARGLALVFAAGLAARGLGYAEALRALTGRAELPGGYTVL
ncbi:MAG: maleylpyruvate isomerase N-terminal domain-containing protein [Dermatophilaceae bacterium]